MDHGKGLSFYCPVEGCKNDFRLRFQQMAHLRRKHNIDTGVLFNSSRNNIGVFPLDNKEDPTLKEQQTIDKFTGMGGLPPTYNTNNGERYGHKQTGRQRKCYRDKNTGKTVWINNCGKSEIKKETNREDRIESDFDGEPEENYEPNKTKGENFDIKFETREK